MLTPLGNKASTWNLSFLPTRRFKLLHFLKTKVLFPDFPENHTEAIKNQTTFCDGPSTMSAQGSFLWLSLYHRPVTGDTRVQKQSSCPHGADTPEDGQLLLLMSSWLSDASIPCLYARLSLPHFFCGNSKTQTQIEEPEAAQREVGPDSKCQEQDCVM